jgi:hypothetical protein
VIAAINVYPDLGMPVILGASLLIQGDGVDDAFGLLTID